MGEKANKMSRHVSQAVGAATGDEEIKCPPPAELHASKIRARSEVVR
jgi:hypothetical protein